jgi:hypothetical protein
MSESLTGGRLSFNPLFKIVLGVFCVLLLPFFAQAKPKKVRTVGKPIVVRDIYVESKNVFDPNVPGEDIWLFRLANRLHIQTKASVIRQELLMRPGDMTDAVRIDESERNLRALPFIKDADIVQKPTADGSVDLFVRTQDSWTTQPQVNVASEGGETTYSAGFQEINLLGYGKDLSYFFKKDEDGPSHQVGYQDPQFFNSRFRLTSSFEDVPTGNIQSVRLERPFYSLTTHAAGGISGDHYEAREEVFEAGQEISRHDRSHFGARPYAGFWLNRDPLNALRGIFEYRYTEDIYTAEANTLPTSLPRNQTLSGPIVGLSFLQSDFIKETFADRAGRVEDINLGHHAGLGVGYVAKKLGSTENSIPFSANHSFGFGGDDKWFGLAAYGTSSRYALYSEGQNGGTLFNTLYFVNLNLYRRLMKDFPMTGVFHAESAYMQNGDADNVLSIGGDAGLRGFKNDLQTGNKSWLVNLENRFFFPKELFHLVYLGGAAFVDAGQVQPEGFGFRTQDIKANVGVGMRFGLSRSSAGTVFRVDLAYAMGKLQQSDRWIISLSSTQGFKRTGNTYSKFLSATTTQ